LLYRRRGNASPSEFSRPILPLQTRKQMLRLLICNMLVPIYSTKIHIGLHCCH
jgi:hypothetical protein